MAITALSTQPNSVTRPDTFNEDSDTFHAELPTLVSEINTTVAAISSASSGAAASITYTFSTTITDADPTPGFLRLDNATQNAATTIRADLVDADGNTRTATLDTFDDSDSTTKGQIMLQVASDAAKFILFNVTALASPSGYKNITVTVVDSSAASPFTNGDTLLLKFTRTGDKGATGSDSMPVATAGGTVDAITATFSPAITLADKQACRVVLAGANTTTTPTFAPDGLTAHTITKNGGAALAAGDLPAALAVAVLQYNLANTRWELLNPATSGAGDHAVEVHTGNGTGSTNTNFRRFTTAAVSTGTAITYADSATNGATFTINEAGLYALYLSDAGSANNQYGITLNYSTNAAIYDVTYANGARARGICISANVPIAMSVVLSLAVNDVIRCVAEVSGNVANDKCQFSIRKIGTVA